MMFQHTRDKTLGPVSISRPSFPGMGIPMLKIRRSWDCLIFNMGIPILARRHLYIETAPWSQLISLRPLVPLFSVWPMRPASGCVSPMGHFLWLEAGCRTAETRTVCVDNTPQQHYHEMVSSLNTSLSQQMYATAMKLQVENELSW